MTSLMLMGVCLIIFAGMRWFWAALPFWAAAGGLGILFNINTGSLRQAIVPNHLLSRVLSIAAVLAWSAIPAGALVGGWVVSATGNVALVYGIIGVLTIAIAAFFRFFTALGDAQRYVDERNDGRRAGRRRDRHGVDAALQPVARWSTASASQACACADHTLCS